jgi:iron complex transport system substrate-binding protein
MGASYMAKWFYPDIFKDLDPEAINKKYFEKWLGVPYKGIWVYPIAS